MNLPLGAQARIEDVQRLLNGALGGIGGVILCGFGVAAAATLVAVVYGWSVEPAGSVARPLLLAAVLAIVAAFCFVVGTRLALHRPNARGSLLSPAAWVLLGGVIAAAAAVAALAAAPSTNQDPLAALAGLAIAGLCFWRAFAITHAGVASAVARRLWPFAPWLGLLLVIASMAVAMIA